MDSSCSIPQHHFSKGILTQTLRKSRSSTLTSSQAISFTVGWAVWENHSQLNSEHIPVKSHFGHLELQDSSFMRTFPKNLCLGNTALPAWRPVTGLHMIRWSQPRIRQLVKFKSPVRTCSLQSMRKARTSGNFLQLGSNQGKGEAGSLAEFFNATTENWSPQKEGIKTVICARGETITAQELYWKYFCSIFILQDLAPEKHISQACANNPTQHSWSLCQSLTKYLTFKHKQV